MTSCAPLRLAVVALLLLISQQAGAQSFSDADAVGALRERRREASPLTVGPHAFKPRIIAKLFDVTTPHLFASVGGGYTDNLLLGDHEAVGVEIRREPYARYEAGARLDTEVWDHRLELDYRARFTEHGGSGGFDRLEHQAGLRLDLISPDLEGHIDGDWRRSAYPSEIQLRGLVWTDVLATRVWSQYSLGRFAVRLGGHAARHDYLDRELEFFSSDRFGADLQLNATAFARVRALIEYNWSRIDYRDQVLTSYQLHQLRAGLDGELSPKLTGSVKLGASLQRLDDDDRGDREYQGFTAECALQWKPIEETTLLLTYARKLIPSVTSTYVVSDKVALVATQALLQDALRFSARVEYEHAVVSPGEHLNRLTAATHARYRITDWIEVLIGYQFVKLESGFPDSDYKEHRVYGSLGVGL